MIHNIRCAKKKIYTVYVVNNLKRTHTVSCDVKIAGTHCSPSNGGYSKSAEAESGAEIVVMISDIGYKNGGNIILNGQSVAYKLNSSKYSSVSVSYTLRLSANTKVLFYYDNSQDFICEVTVPA